mgnify:CR=1 FL=1
MNATNKERFMYILGGLVVGFSAGIVILLIFQTVPQSNLQIVNIALGSLMTMAGSVVGYFFGSSKGSSDKTALLANGKPESPPPAPGA